ncbi:unnamed protein product [Allacma fusca]|uniref:Uncharacterized protein n=1 Tax=Allacma fusca TaxID=39272 RepID=A0A8J2JYT5_9HEXA|nr:unnamed protein product [Allacma fusca]
MQLFNQLYNEIFSSLFTFGMMVLFLNLVLSNAATIRLADKIPFPGNTMFGIGSFIFTWVLLAMYRPSANMMEMSGRIIHEYGLSTEKSHRVLSRSCRSLRVQVGSTFPVKKSTVMTFMSEIVNYTVTALLAT